MYVYKRNGRKEPVNLNKITKRIRALCYDLNNVVDPIVVAIKTVSNLTDGINTETIDKISSNVAENNAVQHPDYGKLAARIVMSNIHKTTPAKFSEAMESIQSRLGIISPTHLEFIRAHAAELDKMIIDKNDYTYSTGALRTLMYSYLHKEGGKCIDRPQYIYMRVAITVHMNDNVDDVTKLARIHETYLIQSCKYATFASPTLFNSCTNNRQLLSCFLFGTGDSAEEITRTQTNTAITSKYNGGIGIWMHSIRGNGSIIHSSNRPSSGLVKQIKIYEGISVNWDQGGKREGAVAIYLELWHIDIMEFLALKNNSGDETQRARRLFYAMWMCELFQKRVQENGEWSLFDETTAPGLSDVYDGMPICTNCGFCQNRNYFTHKFGIKHADQHIVHSGEQILMRKTDDGAEVEAKFAEYVASNKQCRNNSTHAFARRDVFTELYQEYEARGLARRKLKARDVQMAIQAAQMESGTPYILNKDAINRRSPQSNIGTIKSSNLCAEITLWTDKYSYANCTLASLKLDTFLVKTETGYKYDFELLRSTAKIMTKNLDRIVDVTIYPVAECLHNKNKFRPIALGIQALADVFYKMRIPFICDESNELTIRIMENIYYGAVEASCELAMEFGPYSEFAGSPASMGKLQFDLWREDAEYRGITESMIWGNFKRFPLTTLDWDSLKQRVMKFGLRNSCIIAHMPTVSTAIIADSYEAFEPATHNLLLKTTLSGKYVHYNDYMIRHLIELGLYDEKVVNQLYTNGGTIMPIESIPMHVREIYKTVFENSQMDLMRRAALMSAFVDQSMSLNIHLSERTDAKLAAVTKFGMSTVPLKTVSYYIRGLPPIQTMGVGKLTFESGPKVLASEPSEPCTSCSG